MRKIYHDDMKIGEMIISEIEIDLKCRDEVPKLLMGIKYIYCNKEIRDEIFRIFEEMIPVKSRKRVGKQGMSMTYISRQTLTYCPMQ